MKTKRQNKQNNINIITLGCSKNLVDSEVLMNQLQANGLSVTHENSRSNAGVVIVNTCGFIETAKQESIDTILQYAGAKAAGKIDKLYVTGCLSQRYKTELEQEIPEVDAYFGTLDLPFLLEELGADYKHDLIGERNLLTTPPHYAYLKISEGCNRTCSFCAIPLMRGKHVSKSIEQIVAEAKNLVRNGVKEVMLIAQELTYYGLDIYKKRELPELLRHLAGVDGLEWIRMHYAYPYKFPMEVLDVVNEYPNICNYLDMPLQHISDPVLKNMRRLITKDETYQLIDAIRQKSPGIALRTTMLVGFPGETDEDVEELAQFIRQARFERLGIFQYSHEEGTTAYQLEDNVPEEVKAERAAYLMNIQQEISAELNQLKIGNTYKVLFDRKEGGHFIGRTEYDSPEVDNEVLVDARSNKNFVRLGDFAPVRITDATEFDLYGELVRP
ncbi:30S ribosomal protein S12 methylthiotransferase RimO [Sphingobacteriales bacterium UPWRP_1]|nr:ribosomal protein S12 methylthiotransferase RimO [Sphingobacteriales bacterium TSM_CSS]PSJ76624.1 30S ribosomal protein S12 methylthiotransferase RimO [Sphingobacteriales bacterium UPWRP_1]